MNTDQENKGVERTHDKTNRGLEIAGDVTKKTYQGFKHIIYSIRETIFMIVDSKNADKFRVISKIYNIFIMLVAIFSVVPFFLTDNSTLSQLQWIIDLNPLWITIFIIDYGLRLLVSDFTLKLGWKSFFLYPLTAWALIDLIGILPYILVSIGISGAAAFQIFSTFRLFRIIRIFPRLSEGLNLIIKSVAKQWRLFMLILITLAFFLLIGGLLIFNVEYGEPGTQVNNYGDAVWFVFVTITTIGYGDITPVTDVGRSITIFFSIVGIALIAVVTAIFSSGFSELVLSDDIDNKIDKTLKEDNHKVFISWQDDEQTFDANTKILQIKSDSNDDLTKVKKTKKSDQNIIFEYQTNKDQKIVEKTKKIK